MLFASFLLALAGLFAVQYHSIVQSFRDLEDQSIGEVERDTEKTLHGEIRRLVSLNRDWAFWDDTYHFATDRNPEYLAENFTTSSFVSLGLNLICILDVNENVLAGQGYSLENSQPLAFDFCHSGGASPIARGLLSIPADSSRLEGLVPTEHGVMLITSNPILTSQEAGPPHGTLIMGRLIDRNLLERIGETVHGKAALSTFPVAAHRNLTSMGRMVGPTETTRHSDKMSILLPLADLSSRYVAGLEIVLPRVYRDLGQRTWLVSIIGSSIVLFLVGLGLTILVRQAGRTAAGSVATFERMSLRRYLLVGGVIALIGGSITAAVAYLVGQEEDERFLESYQSEMTHFSAELEETLLDAQQEVEGVQRYFLSSQNVTPEEFSAFSSSFIERSNPLHFIAWLPKLDKNERAPWEASRLQDQDLKEIFTMGEDGRKRPAPESAVYLPVQYIQSRSARNSMIGLDIGAFPALADTIEQAVDQNKTELSERHIIDPHNPREGFWIFSPVFHETSRERTINRLEDVTGFVAGFVYWDDAFSGLIRKYPMRGNHRLTLQDITRHEETVPVWRSGPALPEESQSLEFEIPFGNRVFRLTCELSKDRSLTVRRWQRISVYFLGGLVTLVLMIFMLGQESQLNFLINFLTRKEDLIQISRAIRLRYRFFWPVSVSMVILLLAYLIYMGRLGLREQTEETRKDLDRFLGHFQSELDSRARSISRVFGFLEEDRTIAASMERKDRTGLQAAVRAREDLLKMIDPSFEGLIFANPDQSVWLDSENQERLGMLPLLDLFRKMSPSNQEISGLDLDQNGLPMLWGIRAFYEGDSLRGFWVRKAPVSEILQTVVLGTPYHLMVLKDWRGRPGTEPGFLSHTPKAFPSDLLNALRGMDRIEEGDPFQINLGRLHQSCILSPLPGLPESEAAPRLMLCRDQSSQMEALNDIKFQIWLAATLFVVFMILVLWIISNHAERSLGAAVVSREEEVEGRLRAEEHLAATLQSIGEALITLDLNGIVRHFNPVAERYTGRHADAAVGKDLSASLVLLDAETNESALAALTQEIRLGNPSAKPYRGLLKGADGTSRHVEWSSFPIRTGGESRTGTLLVLRDITERHRAEIEHARLEEQLRQSQKMEAIGRLAGGIAHDFNNILTGILGHTEMMIASLHPDDPAYEDALEVRRLVDRSSSLTRQLLAFSRKQIIAPKLFDLGEQIGYAQKMLKRIIGENNEFRFTPTSDRLWVKADASQVEQVVVNLVINAIEAMPLGGRVEVTLRRVTLTEPLPAQAEKSAPGDYAVIEVSDQGQGMSEEVMSHLFEPFFTTKTGKGSGLGLATSYGIVHRYGGMIQVESTVGKGSTFRVCLPIDESSPPEKTVVPHETGREQVPRGEETILLAEDDDPVRTMAVKILQKLGYHVLEAAGGAEALALSRRHTGEIHLLMTDIVMPGMNGRQLSEALLKDRPGTKVLYTSGYSEKVIDEGGKLIDGLHFIPKPYTLHGLARKIREVLESPE